MSVGPQLRSAGATLLRAGPLSLEYRGGGVRYVSLNGVEILRRVYVGVRDRNWRTPEPRISDETIAAGPDSFTIEFTASHVSDEVDFVWRGIIRGDANGSVRWRMDGAPRRSFLRNRIGFCILHPIAGCAGKTCQIEHTNGEIEISRFPSLIAPHQPFLDIGAMEYEAGAGVRAKLRFNGDVFETEDQRNWTDQSFKTYSTPLALPYPVEVTPGDRIAQEVELTLEGIGESEITIDRSQRFLMPEIGFCADSANGAFRRVDVRFPEPGSVGDLSGLQSAKDVECGLFTDHPEVDLKAFIGETPLLRSVRYLIFSVDGSVTTSRAIETARRILPPASLIGGGSATNFTELNRNREAIPLLDFLCWRIDPQVHASDEITLIENIEAQPETVASARAIAGRKPIRISPVLVPRFHGTGAWILGSLNALAQSEVASIAFSECHPLLDEILAFHAEHVIGVRLSLPLRAGALALERGGALALWLANFHSIPQVVRCNERFWKLGPWEVRRIELGASGADAPEASGAGAPEHSA